MHMQQPLRGFSLIEVVLAVGIFSLITVTLAGLWLSTSRSSLKALEADSALGVITYLQATLQEAAEKRPHFIEALHKQLSRSDAQGIVQLFAYQVVTEEKKLPLKTHLLLKDASAAQALGLPAFTSAALEEVHASGRAPFFRIVLSASSANPPTTLETTGDGRTPTVAQARIGAEPLALFRFRPLDTTPYSKGYLALNVRIYAEPLPRLQGTWQPDTHFSPSSRVMNYDLGLTY